MTHLFLFTIGPVQGFIAQARKTRDLYAGSQILSELISAAIEAFPGNHEQIIFPNANSQSKPNRFLGWVDHDQDDEALRSIGIAIEKAVKGAWDKIASGAVEGIQKPKGYDEQIKNALEIFWVFHPATKATYHTAYRDIERTLGAIKNVRPVRQYHYQTEDKEKIYGERGRKCSLDGERNVKFYRMGRTDTRGEGYAIEEKLFLKNEKEVTIIRKGDGIGMGDLPPGEGLSAVSWVKRRYPTEESFPSVAKIALLDAVKRLRSEKKKILDCYEQLFDPKKLPQVCLEMMEAGWVKEIQLDKLERWNQDFDYQYLFEENLTPRYFEDVTQLRLARLLQKKLAKDLETKYYALLLFDGDSMGKWLSGANLEAGHNQGAALKQFHKSLAEHLGTFSQKAFQELNGQKGRAIYAGGDDFLGFVNLEYLFNVLSGMRTQFDEQINQKIEHKKVPFTFSAGLVIAHYKTPLHVVLDWARATEKGAKKYIHPHGQPKDTLGISVLRASGEITQAFVPWNLEKYIWNKDTANPEKQEGQQLCTLSMKELTERLRSDFSDKWLRTLDTEFSLMQDGEGKLKIESGDEALGAEMVKAELKRLLTRACSKHGEERDKAVQDLLPHLHSLLGSKPTENFGNFIKTLYICDFIERHSYGQESEKQPNT